MRLSITAKVRIWAWFSTHAATRCIIWSSSVSLKLGSNLSKDDACRFCEFVGWCIIEGKRAIEELSELRQVHLFWSLFVCTVKIHTSHRILKRYCFRNLLCSIAFEGRKTSQDISQRLCYNKWAPMQSIIGPILHNKPNKSPTYPHVNSCYVFARSIFFFDPAIPSNP